MGPEHQNDIIFSVRALSESTTLQIRVGPALLQEFQARLRQQTDNGFLATPQTWMPWPHDKVANLSWAIQNAAARSRTEALVDARANQTNDDGIAQVYYTAADAQDFVLVGH